MHACIYGYLFNLIAQRSSQLQHIPTCSFSRLWHQVLHCSYSIRRAFWCPANIVSMPLLALRCRKLPDALPCSRLALSATDFKDPPADASKSITRFFTPMAAPPAPNASASAPLIADDAARMGTIRGVSAQAQQAHEQGVEGASAGEREQLNQVAVREDVGREAGGPAVKRPRRDGDTAAGGSGGGGSKASRKGVGMLNNPSTAAALLSKRTPASAARAAGNATLTPRAPGNTPLARQLHALLGAPTPPTTKTVSEPVPSSQLPQQQEGALERLQPVAGGELAAAGAGMPATSNVACEPLDDEHLEGAVGEEQGAAGEMEDQGSLQHAARFPSLQDWLPARAAGSADATRSRPSMGEEHAHDSGPDGSSAQLLQGVDVEEQRRILRDLETQRLLLQRPAAMPADRSKPPVRGGASAGAGKLKPPAQKSGPKQLSLTSLLKKC